MNDIIESFFDHKPVKLVVEKIRNISLEFICFCGRTVVTDRYARPDFDCGDDIFFNNYVTKCRHCGRFLIVKKSDDGYEVYKHE